MSDFEAPDVEVQALVDGMSPWKYSVTQGCQGVTVHPTGRIVSDFHELPEVPSKVVVQIGLFEELLVEGLMTAGSQLPLTGAAVATSENLPENEAVILEWLLELLEGEAPAPLPLPGFEYCQIASGGGAASSGRVGNLEVRLQSGLAQLILENLDQPSGFVYLLSSAVVENHVPLAEKVGGLGRSRLTEVLPPPVRLHIHDPRIENKDPEPDTERRRRFGASPPG